MRTLFSSAVVGVFLMAAGATGCDSSPEDACDNVEAVCAGNANFQQARDACEAAADKGTQSALNCVDAAGTCAAVLACF
ncbi:MAG: hypothetical protein R3F39_00775 [Myxococcota bacterium]